VREVFEKREANLGADDDGVGEEVEHGRDEEAVVGLGVADDDVVDLFCFVCVCVVCGVRGEGVCVFGYCFVAVRGVEGWCVEVRRRRHSLVAHCGKELFAHMHSARTRAQSPSSP
jgi:hypothetical protein